MDQELSQKNKKALAAVAVLAAIVVLVMGAEALTSTRSPSPAPTAATATVPISDVSNTATNTSVSMASTPAGSQTYKNGNYTASGSYSTPGGMESIDVSITLNNGVATSASIQQQATDRDSREYQSAFADGYKTYVVGKDINSIQLSRVSGSSLTPQGFNSALDQIKSQARS